MVYKRLLIDHILPFPKLVFLNEFVVTAFFKIVAKFTGQGQVFPQLGLNICLCNSCTFLCVFRISIFFLDQTLFIPLRQNEAAY